MSAYMCADDTFDYLAGLMHKGRGGYGQAGFTFYLKAEESAELVAVGILDRPAHQLTGVTDADLLIAILRRENLTSLVARYGEKASGDAGEYTMRAVPASQVDVVVALKALCCLDYQSCEGDNYSTSIAKRLITELSDYAVGLLPGYDDAPWGWTRSDAMVGR